jgi:hypothetical protein
MGLTRGLSNEGTMMYTKISITHKTIHGNHINADGFDKQVLHSVFREYFPPGDLPVTSRIAFGPKSLIHVVAYIMDSGKALTDEQLRFLGEAKELAFDVLRIWGDDNIRVTLSE